MGFLRRLLGDQGRSSSSASVASGRPGWMRDGMTVTFFEGDDMLEVKGESFYQDALRQVLDVYGRELTAVLAPEPSNEYGPSAEACSLSVFEGCLWLTVG